MAQPQVMVNPLSIVTPGIFREIFQMTPEDPRVQPRDRPGQKGDGARASSAPAASVPAGALAAPGVTPEVGGSWSAETSGGAPRRSRRREQFCPVLPRARVALRPGPRSGILSLTHGTWGRT